MKTDRQRELARAAAKAAEVVAALCILVMSADYLVAQLRAPQDDARVEALQKEVEADASLAPTLADLQDEITQARAARKARNDWISLVLIASASVFIAGSKWRIALDGRPPVAMSKLVQLEPLPTTRPIGELKPRSAAPPSDEIDLTFVNEIVDQQGTSTEAAILILQAIQAHYGYLPDAALARLCELTDVTPAQVAGTSTFYSRFRRSPVGRHMVRVCHGTACHVSGARQISEELYRQLRIPQGSDTDPDRMFTVEEVACLGCCSLAPVLMIDEHTAGKLTADSVCAALSVVEQAVEHRESA